MSDILQVTLALVVGAVWGSVAYLLLRGRR